MFRTSSVGILAAAIAACAGVQAERGHKEVGGWVQERSGHSTGWEQGSQEQEEISRRVSELLREGLTAERAVQIALVNNPGLQETYEGLGVSQADMLQAGLLTNPRFGLSLGFPTDPAGINETEMSLVGE